MTTKINTNNYLLGTIFLDGRTAASRRRCHTLVGIHELAEAHVELGIAGPTDRPRRGTGRG